MEEDFIINIINNMSFCLFVPPVWMCYFLGVIE